MPIPDGEELEDGQLACSTGPAGLVASVGLFVRSFVFVVVAAVGVVVVVVVVHSWCCFFLVLIVKLRTRSCIHIILTAHIGTPLHQMSRMGHA